MLAKLTRGLIVGFAMISAVSAASLPAYADACLPPSQAPTGLSEFLGVIRAMTGGGVVVGACLQRGGGGLVYVVKVQVGGKVITVRIDAADRRAAIGGEGACAFSSSRTMPISTASSRRR